MQSSIHVLCLLAAFLLSSCSAFESNANCTTLETYTDCSQHLHCEWCGSEEGTYPTSVCFARGSGLSCCTAKNNNNTQCGESSAAICEENQQCYQESIDGDNGDCLVPVCCGPPTPAPCAQSCMAATSTCCGFQQQQNTYGIGFSCAAGLTCCGAGGVNTEFSCCEKGGSCCTVPDQSAFWCCPPSQTCNMNGGCNLPPTL
ncbi:Hypothetical protein, putative [Bodo saltans]|uniref:Membrane-associated protein n=1 Tax=Bodo saltans TaxID=75058 RepID=A0A0S4IYN1_BODSA|nr:Hypothetical protein, putative [Bodo saltans]|eukprot:CUG20880.1 Hypothetical protein, putative [Bodo saltans]